MRSLSRAILPGVRFRRSRGRGFTLMEIILVITVGLSLILSAVAVYNMARDSASAARARDKVLALQATVETLAAANGKQYPDVNQVAQVWQQKRADYNVSPWGGLITHGCPDGSDPGFPTSTGAAIAGLAGQAQSAGTSNPPTGFVECGGQDLLPATYPTPFPTPSGQASVGELDYRRISSVDGAGVTQAATAGLWDDAINKVVDVQSYAISIRGKNGNDEFYQGGIAAP